MDTFRRFRTSCSPQGPRGDEEKASSSPNAPSTSHAAASVIFPLSLAGLFILGGIIIAYKRKGRCGAGGEDQFRLGYFFPVQSVDGEEEEQPSDSGDDDGKNTELSTIHPRIQEEKEKDGVHNPLQHPHEEQPVS